MSGTKKTWEQIYQEWKHLVYSTSIEKCFPFYENDFLIIKHERNTVLPEDYEIRWWRRETVQGLSEKYRKTNQTNIYVTVPQPPRPYDHVAEVLWMYKENEEATTLIWLATLAIYYLENGCSEILKTSDIYTYSEPILKKYRDENLSCPWQGKALLPGSLIDCDKGHLRKALHISSIDDLLFLMFFDICYIKANYQLVCLQ